MVTNCNNTDLTVWEENPADSDHKEMHMVRELLPQQLTECTEAFVVFLQKYYDWMAMSGNASRLLEDSVRMRDVYQATDAYLDLLFKEYGFAWLDNKATYRANVIANLNEIYKAKGSIASIKTLFRCMAGEEVEVVLPKNYMLRPSDGEWERSYYVIAKLNAGLTPESLIGEWVQATTFFPDTEDQVVNIEVMDVFERGNGYYQIQISRYHEGYIFWDTQLTFGDNNLTIVPTSGDMHYVSDGGTGFKPGDIYNIHNYQVNSCYDYILNDANNPQSSYNSAQYAYDDDYTNSISKIIVDSTGSLFTPNTFTRQVLIDKKRNRWGIETVTRLHRTDGVIYEEIRRGEHEFIYTAQRGTEKTIHQRRRDNTYKIEVKQVDGYEAGDILLNFDELIKGFYEVAKGNTASRWWIFWAEDSGLDTAMRGDFNNDGVIDDKDLLIYIRYALGLSVTINTLSSDEQLIRDRIKDSSRVILSRDINPQFTYDPEESTSIKIMETNTDSSIKKIEVLKHGYNFPKAGYTYLVPADSTAIYDLYVNSGYSTIGKFYTDDFVAVERAMVSYGSLPVASGEYYWQDSKGFLSDIINIQDGYYYQDFSYVVQTNEQAETGLSWLNSTVHPAGFIPFVEQLIERNITHNHLQEQVHSTTVSTRHKLLVEPFLKEYHVEPGYSVPDPLELIQAKDGINGLLAEYEYGHMAENVIGIVDWGTATHRPAPYHTDGYVTDDKYIFDIGNVYRFA